MNTGMRRWSLIVYPGMSMIKLTIRYFKNWHSTFLEQVNYSWNDCDAFVGGHLLCTMEMWKSLRIMALLLITFNGGHMQRYHPRVCHLWPVIIPPKLQFVCFLWECHTYTIFTGFNFIHWWTPAEVFHHTCVKWNVLMSWKAHLHVVHIFTGGHLQG